MGVKQNRETMEWEFWVPDNHIKFYGGINDEIVLTLPRESFFKTSKFTSFMWRRFRESFTIYVLILALSSPAFAIDQELLADSIFRAEGGKAAKVPYGILSVKVADEKAARRVCIKTINNNLARWQWAKQEGYQGDFITFLGARYCPVNADNDSKGLNKNWIRLVKHFYLDN